MIDIMLFVWLGEMLILLLFCALFVLVVYVIRSSHAERTVRGAADVWTQRASRGYVFLGVRWYDRSKNPLWTEMHVSNEGKANRTWQHLTFATQAPKAARFVSFCFFAGGYEGEIYRARADNARLE